jgi:hypothetical protein
MKRILLKLALVGAACLLVSVFAAFAKEPSEEYCREWALKHGYCSPNCCVPALACAPGPETAGDDKVIDELTTILKETKSPETFVLTATVLGRMGPQAKRALPAIIRNAERLELLEDAMNDNAAANQSNLTQKLLEAIEMIVDKHAASRKKHPACCVPCTPAPTWNAPVAPPTCCPVVPATPAPALPPSTTGLPPQ